ncbi:MAG: restriction endonuclease, partial [Oscillospiraceae bacterium]|nr:restriction endonuclease [Oscillospiraceae bacterium]
TGELYSVDIQSEGEAVPKYKKASKSDSEFFQKVLEHFPPEERLKQSADMIAKQVNKNNRYSTADVTDYVNRVISGMNEEELAVIETSIPAYANKILRKIESLEQEYRLKQFRKWIDSGKIVTKERYRLKDSIAVSSATSSIPDSLYEAEKDDMNNFERTVIDSVVALDNIHWWHRIIERNDFRLNGFINHYPDFMIMTKSGRVILIETKGDHLDGDDSRRKVELGRRWADLSGRDYRYFMVFKEKNLGVNGSYTLDQFIDVMKDL